MDTLKEFPVPFSVNLAELRKALKRWNPGPEFIDVSTE
jgi:hypothetical protein